jgi:predicted metal-dependent hydrolase
VPEDLVLPPLESLAEAQRLLDLGRPFHAHEVLEGTWKAAPAEERDLWQGLAQLAVGVTHLARGNPTGAATLLRRGAGRLAGYADQPDDIDIYDIDVAALVAFARRTADALESGAPQGAGLDLPRLRLGG